MQLFNDFIANTSSEISVITFFLNIIASGVLTKLLGLVYVRYGNAISNRRMFAKNFVLIGMTTMLIITVVKSSLALSLGLVGALSVIRFRTAIKEPEELAYLFLTIGIGLGLGANQGFITMMASVVIIASIILSQKFMQNVKNTHNLWLTINTKNMQVVKEEDIVDILAHYCSEVNVRRIDDTDKVYEIVLIVNFDDIKDYFSAKKDLQRLSDDLNISIVDNSSIF
jgi:uncharacterized membrane protein YhiD involved in acid resistance